MPLEQTAMSVLQGQGTRRGRAGRGGRRGLRKTAERFGSRKWRARVAGESAPPGAWKVGILEYTVVCE
jgi:hypothetical protein